MGGISRNNIVVIIIMVGSILFYLPFISRQFMGDDWLWLANAKSASSDPSVFLERPMYGYFRPLNMLIVFILLRIFGPNPTIFSFINILLHAVNIWLLWYLLGRLNLSLPVRNISAFIFAFYALNASAVEWISVGHDLWVTGLCLFFAILMLRLIEKPKFSVFILCFVIGFMALLIKESGFVTLGIYFAVLILKGRSPFRREFLVYTLIFVVTYSLYLYGYFVTRTVADRELDLGIGALINIWYLIAYLASPISQRIAEGFPDRFIWILKTIKIFTVIAVPVLLTYIFVKTRTGYRFFILWTVMFISTIAITKWDLSPFALYPERTASRFMYSAVPGIAVVLSWILTTYFKKYVFNKAFITYAVVALFIAGNFLIVHRISKLYFNRQKLASSILDDLYILEPVMAQYDSLIVVTDDMTKTPEIIEYGIHIKAMIYVMLGYQVEVYAHQRDDFCNDKLMENNKKLIVYWDMDRQQFALADAGLGLSRIE